MQPARAFSANGSTTHDNADSEQDPKPAKVARTDSRSYRGASATDSRTMAGGNNASQALESQQYPSQQPPRTRGVTACEICRSRKTKCDNRRPSCSYCTKVGVTCNYLEGDQGPTCHIVGPQLLEAISNLTDLLQRQQQQQQPYQPSHDNFSPPSLPTVDAVFSPYGQGDKNAHYFQNANRSAHQRYSKEEERLFSRERESRGSERLDQRTISHEGLESVLNWVIFPEPKLHSISLADNDISVPSTPALPKFEYSELVRLKARYIEIVHIKNPILDLQKLHKMIFEVAENGPDWSTRTCLVALICALAALAQTFPVAGGSDESPVALESPHGVAFNYDPELAMQYWGVAVKRLGFALEQNNLESVQCLCLAGVWYMQNFRPLQAWKYFSFAGNAWYSATLKRQPSPSIELDGPTHGHALTVEQSLYFTTYKSECELRLELAIPGSILQDVDLSYDFPLPPNIPDHYTDSDSHNTERGWYYYLAEIASRHLINRILRGRSRVTSHPTAKEIWRMLSELEIFESQLSEWHMSLPSIIAFSVPQGTSMNHVSDELVYILRSRYMIIKELCYRPFVQLCVNNTLDVGVELMSKIAALASQGLQYCLFRIQAATVHRHHGLWFSIRACTTCSLVLIGADIARRDLRLNAASLLVLPTGWRAQIIRTKEIMSPYWNERRGGIRECSQILDWALSLCEIQTWEPSRSE